MNYSQAESELNKIQNISFEVGEITDEMCQAIRLSDEYEVRGKLISAKIAKKTQAALNLARKLRETMKVISKEIEKENL